MEVNSMNNKTIANLLCEATNLLNEGIFDNIEGAFDNIKEKNSAKKELLNKINSVNNGKYDNTEFKTNDDAKKFYDEVNSDVCGVCQLSNKTIKELNSYKDYIKYGYDPMGMNQALAGRCKYLLKDLTEYLRIMNRKLNRALKVSDEVLTDKIESLIDTVDGCLDKISDEK